MCRTFGADLTYLISYASFLQDLAAKHSDSDEDKALNYSRLDILAKEAEVEIVKIDVGGTEIIRRTE